MRRGRIVGEDTKGFGAAAVTFTLLASMFAFGALVVSAQAWSRSNDAKEIAATGGAGGTRVTLSEFAIEPAMVEIPVGGAMIVTNTGKVEHNVPVKDEDLKTEMLGEGETARLDLAGLKPGTYTLICEVSGHASQGMTAMLHLGTSASATDQLSADSQEANDASDELMAERTKAFPAETEGVGAQPLAPTVLADGTKQFDLTAEVVDWEVEPGKTVQAWAYNGVVPGPTIKVATGDRVKVVLDNQLPESNEH